MITPGAPDGFRIDAVFLPATPSRTDPLAQRSYLAIKFKGGLVVDNATIDGVGELRDHIAQQVETVLQQALAQPQETVVAETTA